MRDLSPAVLGEAPSGHHPGAPYSPLYSALYHPQAGALQQAQYVFLGGNGLPKRWQGRCRFVIAETGFGLGHNFLSTWQAWLADPARCEHLVFLSLDKHPLQQAALAQVHGLDLSALGEPGADANTHSQDERTSLARRLVAAWPSLTPGMHTLHFDGPQQGQRPPSRISLLLGLGDIADLLPQWLASVDAFYLDGFTPDKNPHMWDGQLLSRLNRLAAPDATVATWTAASSVHNALVQAGFEVQRVPGQSGKCEVSEGVYRPRHVPPSQPGGLWPQPDPEHRHAIVLGAGLAGCSAAYHLCRQGWRVTLIDQHGEPAQEASGNPGGLFHSVLHADDGLHARAHRAAALHTWRLAQPLIESGRIRGQAAGLLRLDARAQAAEARALLWRQHLPPSHVQWLTQDQAQGLAGLEVPSAGWFFHEAGWLHPAGLARWMLESAAAWRAADGAPLLQCLWGQAVDALQPDAQGHWQALRGGQALATAPTLVLCNAMQAAQLAGTLPTSHAVAALPLSAVRGQISALTLTGPGKPADPAGDMGFQALRLPSVPVAGSGYVLPLGPHTLLCGATSQHHDPDPGVREADHRHNLLQAWRLGAAPGWPDPKLSATPRPLPQGLQGRTAWRATTPDRLPLVGALPWSAARLTAQGHTRRMDQARLMPRERHAQGGLYALTGLGSRGITWCVLAGELLSHWVTGAPCPVEIALRDALDPARFLVRQLTKGAGP